MLFRSAGDKKMGGFDNTIGDGDKTENNLNRLQKQIFKNEILYWQIQKSSISKQKSDAKIKDKGSIVL